MTPPVWDEENKGSAHPSIIIISLSILFLLTSCDFVTASLMATATLLPVSTQTVTGTPTVRPTYTPTPLPTATPTLLPTQTFVPTPTAFTIEPFPQGVPMEIGRSVRGRPLQVYTFGSGSIQRLIVAGIHGGNEYNTVDLAFQLIDYLKLNPSVIPSNVTLFILPDLNPDGYTRDHDIDGRANANGVDLNRNWDANWQSSWPLDGCWDYRPISAGKGPNSEPETQALANFINKQAIDAIINYHSALLGVFAGGIPPSANSISLAKAIAAESDYKYPPEDTGCKYTGYFVDWAGQKGIAAVDLELNSHTKTEFDVNLKVLSVLLKWKYIP